jgi:hypothetical protein
LDCTYGACSARPVLIHHRAVYFKTLREDEQKLYLKTLTDRPRWVDPDQHAADKYARQMYSIYTVFVWRYCTFDQHAADSTIVQILPYVHPWEPESEPHPETHPETQKRQQPGSGSYRSSNRTCSLLQPTGLNCCTLSTVGYHCDLPYVSDVQHTHALKLTARGRYLRSPYSHKPLHQTAAARGGASGVGAAAAGVRARLEACCCAG